MESSIWNIITGEPLQLAYRSEGRAKQRAQLETEDAQESFDRIRYQLANTTRQKKLKFYQTAYFGTPETREIRRKWFREGLKEQMARKHQDKAARISEEAEQMRHMLDAERAVMAKEQAEVTWEKQQRRNMVSSNQILMDERKVVRRQRISEENTLDRSALLKSPINWNHTLH